MFSKGQMAAAILLLAALGPALGGGQAADVSGARTNVDRTFEGPDVIMLEFETSEGFTVLGSSILKVTAQYDRSAKVQRISAFASVFEGARNTDCEVENSSSPCLVGIYARTAEDVATSTEPTDNGDLRTSTGPGVNLTVETGHNHGAFESLTTGIDWAETKFPALSGDNTNYHVAVAVPKAQTMSVDLDLETEGDFTLTAVEAVEAGFEVWPDDMQAAGAHTAAGTAYTGDDGLCGRDCGEASVPVPEKPAPANRMYAAMGPTAAGHYVIHNHAGGNSCVDCYGVIPIAFTGIYGVETPEKVHQAYAVGAAGSVTPDPVITVIGPANKADRDWDDGPYEFYVHTYGQAGPGDLVATGFVAPPP